MSTRIRNNKKVVDQEFVCMVLTARLTGHVTLSALPAVYERNETLPYTYTYVSAGPSLEGAIRLRSSSPVKQLISYLYLPDS